jgi:hypothetical protein
MVLQSGERASFIDAHQPAVSSDVGCENSRQMTIRLRWFQNALHAPGKNLGILAAPD